MHPGSVRQLPLSGLLAAEIPALDVRICFFGDSFTVGVGDATGAGWVGPVTATARRHRPGVELTAYPMGVRRDTTVDLARRWFAEADRRLAGGDRSGVAVAIGTNDVDLHTGRRRVERNRSLGLLADLLGDAHAASWPCMVVGPPPVSDADQCARGADLAAGMAAVCAARGLPFVDLTGPLGRDPVWATEVGAGDGYHPSTAGYARMAAAIQSTFDGWLTGMTTVADPPTS